MLRWLSSLYNISPFELEFYTKCNDCFCKERRWGRPRSSGPPSQELLLRNFASWNEASDGLKRWKLGGKWRRSMVLILSVCFNVSKHKSWAKEIGLCTSCVKNLLTSLQGMAGTQRPASEVLELIYFVFYRSLFTNVLGRKIEEVTKKSNEFY